MKKLVFLTISILIMSCSHEDNTEPNGFVKSVGVEFNILNQKGDDLLNPATSGYLPLENMKLYYLINGKKIEVYDPNMAYPRNIGLIKETTPYRLGIGTYDGEDGLVNEENDIKTGIAIAYLELSEEITDTIKTEWESKVGKYFVNKRVWYNGELQESVDLVFKVRK